MNENGKLDIKKSRNFNWGGLVKEAFRHLSQKLTNRQIKEI